MSSYQSLHFFNIPIIDASSSSISTSSLSSPCSRTHADTVNASSFAPPLPPTTIFTNFPSTTVKLPFQHLTFCPEIKSEATPYQGAINIDATIFSDVKTNEESSVSPSKHQRLQHSPRNYHYGRVHKHAGLSSSY